MISAGDLELFLHRVLKTEEIQQMLKQAVGSKPLKMAGASHVLSNGHENHFEVMTCTYTHITYRHKIHIVLSYHVSYFMIMIMILK